MAEEKWLPVVGYEGYYEVSSLGNVRSVDRLVWNGHSWWMKPGKVLAVSLSQTRRGTYRRVQLSRDGKGRPYLVYVLVARAHLGELPEGMETRHGPLGQLDDSVDNMSYGTAAENQHDRVRDGTDNRGSRNANAVLTETIVLECRQRKAAGESYAALGREFGVTRQGMRMACSGGWQHAEVAA